jgi:hypothetical protein
MFKDIGKGIGLSVNNLVDSVSTTFFEFRKTRKYVHSLKCDVILCYPTGLAEKYTGLTDEGNNFLIVPILLRIYIDLHPIYIEGVKTFIVSSKYHGTISINTIAKISESFKGNMQLRYTYTEKLYKLLLARFNYNNDVIDCTVKTSGTMDVSLFDNSLSSDFTAAAFKIISTKALAFLEEVPRRVFILSLCLVGAICLSIGICIGALGMGIIAYFIT